MDDDINRAVIKIGKFNCDLKISVLARRRNAAELISLFAHNGETPLGPHKLIYSHF